MASAWNEVSSTSATARTMTAGRAAGRAPRVNRDVLATGVALRPDTAMVADMVEMDPCTRRDRRMQG